MSRAATPIAAMLERAVLGTRIADRSRRRIFHQRCTLTLRKSGDYAFPDDGHCQG